MHVRPPYGCLNTILFISVVEDQVLLNKEDHFFIKKSGRYEFNVFLRFTNSFGLMAEIYRDGEIFLTKSLSDYAAPNRYKMPLYQTFKTIFTYQLQKGDILKLKNLSTDKVNFHGQIETIAEYAPNSVDFILY